MKNTDVLIIGAGPSGTVAAAILAKNGFNTTILEKSQFPRFVIGESLLPRCMEHFETAGFIDVIESAGFQKKYGARFIKGNYISDFNFTDQHTKGWSWTWQVPRGEFDKLLADEVEKRGVEIQYNTSVSHIDFDPKNPIIHYTDKSGHHKIEAKYIIDASGYGRVIPRLLNLDEPSSLPPRTAVFSHVYDHNREKGFDAERIDIITHDHGIWAWIIPFSNGMASVGFAGDMEYFSQFGSDSAALLNELIQNNPYVHKRLGNPDYVFEPKRLQGYAIGVKSLFGNRFVLTGNSAEFLDPIFSSGVTFATESASLAAHLITKELNGHPVDWDLEYTKHIRSGVDVFRSYIKGWYNGTLQDIFYDDNKRLDFQKQICSVLAGYVWDESNPVVRKHNTIIETVSDVLKIQNR